MSCNNGFNNNNTNCNSFVRHISEFVGQTVTIFTASGGASGCGFTGVILAVNCNFVRLSTFEGTAPENPLSEIICPRRRRRDRDDDDDEEGCGSIGGGLGGGMVGGIGGVGGGIGGGMVGGMTGGRGCKNHDDDDDDDEDDEDDRRRRCRRNVGSVCDIPIDRIVCFCHNAI